MTIYSAESFHRATIRQSTASNQSVPYTLKVSKIPTLTNGLLTISPNTSNEEIIEYNGVDSSSLTITVVKNGINPSSQLLTTNGVDYNNPTYIKAHSQNDVIRGDVNHIHINQASSNSVLATNTGVGITKLSVAATDAGDPIAVGNNDPRVGDASTTNKGVTKLSVAPVSAANPIACGDNDSRLIAKTDATISMADTTTNNVNSSRHGWAPKAPNDATQFLNGLGAYSVPSPQVFSSTRAIGSSISSFTVTSTFQPKYVKVTAYASSNAVQSVSTGLIYGTTTNNVNSFYAHGIGEGSDAGSTNIINLRIYSSGLLSYTGVITSTGITFTLVSGGFNFGTALIECFG